ncbi:hypothetical protein, partial [Acetobacter ghanensis]|uniref:hypothetical protein n=1 Tax=Acetobacter ghanensis TaxID=431306 RepID=UPI00222F1506
MLDVIEGESGKLISRPVTGRTRNYLLYLRWELLPGKDKPDRQVGVVTKLKINSFCMIGRQYHRTACFTTNRYWTLCVIAVWHIDQFNVRYHDINFHAIVGKAC